MAITLDATTLDADLIWVERLTSPQLTQSITRDLDGHAFIEEDALLGGLPVTLAGGRNGGRVSGVMTDAELVTLRASVVANATMTLTLHDDTELTVRWRHDGPPIDADPLVPSADPQTADLYIVTLRFITVIP